MTGEQHASEMITMMVAGIDSTRGIGDIKTGHVLGPHRHLLGTEPSITTQGVVVDPRAVVTGVGVRARNGITIRIPVGAA